MLVFCESVDSTKQGGTAVMKLPSLMIFLNRQGRFCFYSYNFGGVIMKKTNKKNGRYGIHGGQYIPEVLMREVLQLEKEYEFYKKVFWRGSSLCSS